MTRKQYQKKVRELAEATRKNIIERAEKILRSGAVDLANAENNYYVPKLVMVVCCEDAAEQWKPPSIDAKDKKTLANLRCF